MKKLWMVALAGLALACGAQARQAQCEFYGNDGTHRLACVFTPLEQGSFSVESAKKGKALYGDILMVTVYITGKDEAQVSGLTRAGINSRWGEAHRDSKDKACWKGEDFKVCARAK